MSKVSPAGLAIERLEQLGQISDHPEHLGRTFLSPANLRAAGVLLAWMAELGMATDHAADGTVRGVLPGADPNAQPLLLGSHIDTVVDAGKYDGALGIIAALATLETLAADGVTLPFPVHLIGFSDEEGTRFQTTYLGSRTVTGGLGADAELIADALAAEGWHGGATEIRYAPGDARGYIELHIEQGRVLEESGEAAGAVSAIAGQSRLAITITGHADHAGTTPMALRRDALAAAAECVLASESLATKNPPAVITVGKLEVHPGSPNVIPGAAEFSIDLRHPDDAERRRLRTELLDQFQQIASRRGIELASKLVQDGDATPCDAALTEQVLAAVESVTGSRRSLISGAGHDGVAIAAVAPIAMILLRSRDGLSHHPDEFTSPEDIAVGIKILAQVLRSLA